MASYRAGCFAKYLPENGWQPTVLCQDWPKGSPDYDPEFVGALPSSVEVIRVPIPKLAGFSDRVVLRKIMPYFWAHRVPIPWWQRARRELLVQLKRTRFDATWGTSDPMSPLALAEEAAARIPCRWVADLRDSFNVQRFGSWYKRPFFAAQERRLCRRADAVTTVSNGLAEVIQQRTGRPVQVIHNGFDPELFTGAVAPEKRVFRIVYAGKLVWPMQNPQPLLQALDLCLSSGRIPRAELELAFYGSDLDRFAKAVPGLLDRLPVRSCPRVPHEQIIQVLKSSAVLLLLSHPHEKGVLTGKLFDYLATGRPILAVPDDRGDVSALLHRTGAGLSLSQAPAIADQLAAWYQAWKAGAPLLTTRNEPEIARYSRREQTKTLAALLETLATKA